MSNNPVPGVGRPLRPCNWCGRFTRCRVRIELPGKPLWQYPCCQRCFPEVLSMVRIAFSDLGVKRG